jgi:glycosyltransferase involved in cell wall biosynthesis
MRVSADGADRARERLNVLYVGTLPPYPGGTAILGAQLLAGLAASGDTVRALAPLAASTDDAFRALHPELHVTRYPVPYFQTQSHVDVSPEYFRLEGQGIERQLAALIADARPDVIVSGRESVSFFVPAVARAHAIPCVALPDEVLRALGLADVKIIQNAVDPSKFRPGAKDPALLRELAIPADAIIALHASNLIDAKRPLDVLRAAADVTRANAAAFFVIVGDGPLRHEMEDFCARAAIRDRVRFTGWIDHDRMPAYLRLAEVVLVPSETEALALIYLEAQASGCVVVASDIPAAREVITDGASAERGAERPIAEGGDGLGGQVGDVAAAEQEA